VEVSDDAKTFFTEIPSGFKEKSLEERTVVLQNFFEKFGK
jgi:hypothetical protein